MTEEKERKCVIKSKEYGNDNYVSGIATYEIGLHNAQIFEEDKIPDYMKGQDHEIIYLDSEKGLELLAEEVEFLNGQISQMEWRLNNMKEGRERLYNANPEMLDEYAEKYQKFNHPVIGISKDTKKIIIKEIVSKKQK